MFISISLALNLDQVNPEVNRMLSSVLTFALSSAFTFSSLKFRYGKDTMLEWSLLSSLPKPSIDVINYCCPGSTSHGQKSAKCPKQFTFLISYLSNNPVIGPKDNGTGLNVQYPSGVFAPLLRIMCFTVSRISSVTTILIIINITLSTFSAAIIFNGLVGCIKVFRWTSIPKANWSWFL